MFSFIFLLTGTNKSARPKNMGRNLDSKFNVLAEFSSAKSCKNLGENMKKYSGVGQHSSGVYEKCCGHGFFNTWQHCCAGSVCFLAGCFSESRKSDIEMWNERN